MVFLATFLCCIILSNALTGNGTEIELKIKDNAVDQYTDLDFVVGGPGYSYAVLKAGIRSQMAYWVKLNSCKNGTTEGTFTASQGCILNSYLLNQSTFEEWEKNYNPTYPGDGFPDYQTGNTSTVIKNQSAGGNRTSLVVYSAEESNWYLVFANMPIEGDTKNRGDLNLDLSIGFYYVAFLSCSGVLVICIFLCCGCIGLSVYNSKKRGEKHYLFLSSEEREALNIKWRKADRKRTLDFREKHEKRLASDANYAKFQHPSCFQGVYQNSALKKPKDSLLYTIMSSNDILWVFNPEMDEVLVPFERMVLALTIVFLMLCSTTIYTAQFDSAALAVSTSSFDYVLVSSIISALVMQVLKFILLHISRFSVFRNPDGSRCGKFEPKHRIAQIVAVFIVIGSFFALWPILLIHTCGEVTNFYIYPLIFTIIIRSFLFPGIVVAYLSYWAKISFGVEPDDEKAADSTTPAPASTTP